MPLLPRRAAVAIVLFFVCAALRAIAAESLAPSAPAAAVDENDKRFDYDRSVPLAVHELSRTTRDDALIRDITFTGVDAPIKAYLISPTSPRASLAGILFVHWLGEPATTNRLEFLNEAVALASQGMTSVLVDAMWARPDWYQTRVPEEDYAHSIRQVIELRRAMDLLLAQPGVDAKRIAYVGHDFGAMYGAVLGGVDHRASTYVLMAGVPHFIDWFLFAKKPKSPDNYRRQIAPLDPVNYLPRLAPAPVFFQFAARDEFVSADAAAKFYAAALPQKQMSTYDARHDLQKPEATADRVTWLIRFLAPKR